MDEYEQLEESVGLTTVDREQTKPDEEKRKRPGRPRKSEARPVTNVPQQQSEDASAPQAIDKEQGNTTSSHLIKTSPNIVRPQSDIQAPPPPSARSRLRRVSQRLSLFHVAPTEASAAQADATMIDQTTSMPPAQVETLVVQQIPSQPSTPQPQDTTPPKSSLAARTSVNAARIVFVASSNTPHKPGSSTQPKQARVKGMSAGEARRVSGLPSVTPRRVLSSATSETPMMGTGASSSAVRRHVVRQDDLGSEDELDQ